MSGSVLHLRERRHLLINIVTVRDVQNFRRLWKLPLPVKGFLGFFVTAIHWIGTKYFRISHPNHPKIGSANLCHLFDDFRSDSIYRIIHFRISVADIPIRIIQKSRGPRKYVIRIISYPKTRSDLMYVAHCTLQSAHAFSRNQIPRLCTKSNGEILGFAITFYM